MSAELQSKMLLGLRRFAKSVTVITCQHEGIRFAMSATAVSEVSIEPPSMLICINRGAKMSPIMHEGEFFCINMLHSGQENIARNCGGVMSGEDRFSVGDWRNDENDTPYLADAQVNFFCQNRSVNAFGTHDIFIGEVMKLYVADAIDPLIYADGQYLPIANAKNGGIL